MEKLKNLINQYSYHIEYDPVDKIYISRCAELPSLTAHGKTQAQSLKEIKTAVLGALKWLKKEKEDFPDPFNLHKFSGEFRIRISPEKHRQIAIESSLQNISMNQFIVNKL